MMCVPRSWESRPGSDDDSILDPVLHLYKSGTVPHELVIIRDDVVESLEDRLRLVLLIEGRSVPFVLSLKRAFIC